MSDLCLDWSESSDVVLVKSRGPYTLADADDDRIVKTVNLVSSQGSCCWLVSENKLGSLILVVVVVKSSSKACWNGFRTFTVKLYHFCILLL